MGSFFIPTPMQQPHFRQTKIIATVGPASDSEERLAALYDAGVTIIRFNFSHAKQDHVREVMDRIRRLNASGRTRLATLADLKGPEIRTGDLDRKIPFQAGQHIRMYTDITLFSDDGSSLFCDYPHLVEDVEIGGTIEIESGLLSVRVMEKSSKYIVVEAKNDCIIGSRRHVNLPGVRLRLPGLTQKDKDDMVFCAPLGFDFAAMSFVRHGRDVKEFREILHTLGVGHMGIISKVENQEGLENLDSIIEASDGILVARGDLGIEVPIERLPIYQRDMVLRTRRAGKFVIVATQMIETMMENPVPTRAEVSDIYHAVAQEADCTMLSGETAMGKYPVEAVSTMRLVLDEAEKSVRHAHDNFSNEGLRTTDIEKKLLIRSALQISEELGMEAIIILTKTGLLSRLASALRPNTPVYSVTMRDTTFRMANALFGISPVLLTEWSPSYQDNVEKAVRLLQKQGSLPKTGKIIAVTDIQKDSREIPVLEILDLASF